MAQRIIDPWDDLTNIELKEEILLLLTESGGEMDQKKLCTLLGITAHEIPWGYNIGYAQCLQASGEYHLILSEQIITPGPEN